MTHTHVAGSIHADSSARAPSWLSRPSDVNTLLGSLWSSGVAKDENGVLTVAGLSVTEIANQVGTPVYVVDGVGHFPHREAPDLVAKVVLDHLSHG